MKKKLYCLLIGAALLAVSGLHGQSNVALVKKWGEFGTGPGQLKFPTMIASDHDGNLFVVDQHNYRVQKFDGDGNFILMWGKQGSGAGEFYYPYGIAIDSKDNIYVSDMNNNRVQKFSSAGVFLGSVGAYGSGDGQFKYPYGIAIDANDILYVIDAFNYRIQKFEASDLRYIAQWGSAENIGIKLYMPHEIAITKEGDVILSDRQNHRLSIFNADGKLVRRFGDYGEGTGTKGGLFSEPHGMAIGASGDTYICDRYNFRVQQFDSKGNFKFQWTTTGVFEDDKSFPLGICLGQGNNIYVTDHYSHCVLQYRMY